MMRSFVALLLALSTLVSAACASWNPFATPDVLATTGVLADLARNVAGDRLKVASIVPPGVEVHDYQPRPEDARRVSTAKLVLLNGHHLDEWAEDLVRGASARTVELTKGLPVVADDPHLWFDVQLAKRYVERIREALTALDPQGADGFAQRAQEYGRRLDVLDAEIKRKVAEIPQSRRVLVTSHDAYGYFARAYGFRVVGFVQPEAGKDPSPAALAALVADVRRAGVPAVFAESGASSRLTEALAREAGVARVVTDLPSDAGDQPPADTYVGMMTLLVDKIVSALK
ncbi:MAG: zinc ABC transporter substrate-binding protein [Chloroflexi bacterium]|nr:zinc ABC transporter substrate-binding protein [Chloroflexota bacterium]